MTEVEIVERLRRMLPVRKRGLILGIGDDCAIYRPSGSREDLVLTSDQTIEGVHFRSGARARNIGSRAALRALSDIAAMGAEPRFCLISVAAPASFSVERFYVGVRDVLTRYRFDVAGGDLARAKRFSCDVAVCGSVPRGQALRRDGARPGDAIYVSGLLGGNAASGYRRMPEPRIALGRRLRERATACMDISDGLALDLYRMCMASGTGAFLHSVPAGRGATERQALHGGEDYELLYSGPAGLPGIPIGVMNDGPAGMVSVGGYPINPVGWDHFGTNPLE
ncbi:MAG TPA: thiamine-phosphate kinase [Bryobacteraceae bacterium]|nr:thiamine-phosphate kinase [Bryobacteraceae bacterium]